MGRAKRSRKWKAQHRRAKRFARKLREVHRLAEEQRGRTEARKRIEASDLPDEVKLAAALIVDPVGGLQKLINEKMREAGVTPPSERDDE